MKGWGVVGRIEERGRDVRACARVCVCLCDCMSAYTCPVTNPTMDFPQKFGSINNRKSMLRSPAQSVLGRDVSLQTSCFTFFRGGVGCGVCGGDGSGRSLINTYYLYACLFVSMN